MKKILILENGKAIKRMFIHFIENENYKILNYRKNDKRNDHDEFPDLVIADLTSIKDEKFESLINFRQSSGVSTIPFLLIDSNKSMENQKTFLTRTYYLTPDKLGSIIKKIFISAAGDSPW